MKVSNVLLLAAGSAATAAATGAAGIEADPAFPRFQWFVQRYGRTYNNQAELEGRFAIFKSNLELISQRNNDGGQDVHGVNQFADMHPDEFRKQYLGLSGAPQPTSGATFKVYNETATKPAANIDWRLKGAVTAVKNQGQCGSCWAFSATEQIESDVFLASGVLDTLAPQQIVSCDTTNGGCDGGWPYKAYEYVTGTGGLEAETSYPYTSGTTQADGTCTFSSSAVVTGTAPTGWAFVSQRASQEANMYTQLQSSPVSVCVDATLFQTYQSGIITAADGCGTDINHAVQAVGIGGADTGTPYYLVRNSWSSSWGQDGYCYVATGSNVCGITSSSTVTTI